MKNLEYKKINLRDFRHNFTQLKDSFSNGQIYEVIEKGSSIGYFVPSDYEIVATKKKKVTNEDFKNLIREIGDLNIALNTKDQSRTDYMNIYREALERKYLKK